MPEAGRAQDRPPHSLRKNQFCPHTQEPLDRTREADCSIWLYFLIVRLCPTISLSPEQSVVLTGCPGEGRCSLANPRWRIHRCHPPQSPRGMRPQGWPSTQASFWGSHLARRRQPPEEPSPSS